MLFVISNERNTNQKHRYHFIIIINGYIKKIAIIKRWTIIKRWWTCGKLEFSYIADGHVNGAATLENILAAPQKFSRVTIWPSNYPRPILKRTETYIYLKTCSQMFMILLSVIAKKWYIHTMEYYLASKNEILMHDTAWRTISITLNERRQS